MKLDILSLQELIGLAAQGNHAAFAQLYERTHAHLFGVAVRILGNGQSAEDVLQEAYVSIWKSAGGYRSEVGGQSIQPMTWLIAIVRNKALDALRVRARRKEMNSRKTTIWRPMQKLRRKPAPIPAPCSCWSRPHRRCTLRPA